MKTLKSVVRKEKTALPLLRTGAGLVTGLMLTLGSAQAVSAAPFASEGLIVASDFGRPARVRVMDPDRNLVVYDLDLKTLKSERCNHPMVACTPLGLQLVNYGDETYFDVSVTVIDSAARDTDPSRTYSVVQRIRPTTPATVMWTLKSLDFSAIPDGTSYCNTSTSNGSRGCRLRLTHAIQILQDKPDQKKVSVIMADMDNMRVLQATLDYTNGNTVGKVDWVLGTTHPDWPDLAAPNGVQYLPDLPGGPYLMTSFYTVTATPHAGGRQILWKWTSTGWQLAWRFPELDDGSGWLNSPHMGEFLKNPLTGKVQALYSHSRGLANAWGTYEDWGGTFGVLELGATPADPPRYLFDVRLFPADPAAEVHFSRDQDYLDDGTLLLTDAACENAQDCPWESVLYRIRPTVLSAASTGKSGNYTPELNNLQFVDVPETDILAEYRCGFGVLFEAEWIPAAKVGKSLRDAATKATTPCP